MLITNGTTPRIPLLMVDATDNETAEPGLTVTCQISKNGAAFVTTTNSPTETGSGWYYVALTAAETNTDGPLFVRANGTGANEWRDYHEVTTVLPANTVQVSGDATAADNIEATFDGTGYISPVAPAQQQQVENIAITGAPVNTVAASATLTTGTQSSGTYASTYASDNVRHVIADSGGTIDLYYEFSIGGDGVASSASWEGFVNGTNDSVAAYAYDWVGAAWQQIGAIAGKNGTTDDTQQWSLTTAHTGTGANLGLARVRLYGTGLTTASLNTDRLLLGYAVINRSVGYVDGAVWVDTVGGVAGTELYVNGTADRPTASLADARTIAVALGLRNYRIAGGSSITLANSYMAANFTGGKWNLALGGQSVSNCTFVGARVSGTCTGTDPTFLLCHIGDCTLPPCDIGQCHLEGTITAGSAGTYSIMRCMDNTAAGIEPVIDFGAAVGGTDISIRKYGGGIGLRNMRAGDYVALDGMGRLIIAASCTAGEVRLRGLWDVENSGSGQTFIDTAVLNGSRVNAEILDVLSIDTFGEPSSVPAATSSLKDKIGWLFALARNKVTMTSTTQRVRNDTDSASIGTSTHEEDGTTYTRSEWS